MHFETCLVLRTLSENALGFNCSIRSMFKGCLIISKSASFCVKDFRASCGSGNHAPLSLKWKKGCQENSHGGLENGYNHQTTFSVSPAS